MQITVELERSIDRVFARVFFAEDGEELLSAGVLMVRAQHWVALLAALQVIATVDVVELGQDSIWVPKEKSNGKSKVERAGQVLDVVSASAASRSGDRVQEDYGDCGDEAGGIEAS